MNDDDVRSVLAIGNDPGRARDRIRVVLERALNHHQYLRVLHEDLGVEDEVIAAVAHVHVRTVRRWRSRQAGAQLRPAQADAVDCLRTLALVLVDSGTFMDPRGVGVWLKVRNASLGWQAPYQLLADELEAGFKAALREAENFVRPGAGSAWPLNRELVSPLIFLCHSSGDKPAVRQLYRRLIADGLAPWLDEEDIPPGANWELAIRNAVRAADFILVCLSDASTTTSGYVHKEIRLSLDVANEQPDGAIFVIPVRLEECTVPERLQHLHWVDLFLDRGYLRLVEVLRREPQYPRRASAGSVPPLSSAGG